MSLFIDLIISFSVGGAICAVGQIIMDKTKLTPGRILTIFVLSGALLGAVGIYEKIAEFAGMGASIPITGFGYAMVKGTKEAILKSGPIGILTGPLSSASAGIETAVLMGLLSSFLSRSHQK